MTQNHSGFALHKNSAFEIHTTAALFGGVPTSSEMRGPFPIMSTPYFEDGSVDYEALAREARWTERMAWATKRTLSKPLSWTGMLDLSRDEKATCPPACPP